MPIPVIGGNGGEPESDVTGGGHQHGVPTRIITFPSPGAASRVGITSSNLADPDSPIHALASQFQAYMHMPDPQALYVTMGAMAANMMTGTPVWLMLIGASGSGKTALLKSILTLPKVICVSSIKGEAALLSGTKKKEMARDATGGLLKELGNNGCLAFMDFTSVLSKSYDAINELLGILRELYDRTWSRTIGGEGGRRIDHHGRVNMIAGVTHAIDRVTMVAKEMGERCVYYRFPFTTGYQEGRSAVQEIDPDESERDRQMLVEAMFMALGLSFDKPVKRRKLGDLEADRLVTLGQFAALCRTPVPRDTYKHEVIDVAAPEVATRISKQLTQLYLGMEVIGNTERERWEAVKKCAWDSMPLVRKLVLENVVKGQGHSRTGEVAKQVRVSESAVRRVLEDLELLGVVAKNGAEGWVVSDWTVEKIRAVEREGDGQLELELE